MNFCGKLAEKGFSVFTTGAADEILICTLYSVCLSRLMGQGGFISRHPSSGTDSSRTGTPNWYQ